MTFPGLETTFLSKCSVLHRYSMMVLIMIRIYWCQMIRHEQMILQDELIPASGNIRQRFIIGK